MEKFWSNLGFKPLFIQEVIGHAGGIWVLSCIDDIVVSITDSMHQAIAFSVKRRDTVWYCTAIYASPIFSVCCNLWEHLRSVKSNITGPWLLIGDFNEIIFTSEVLGGNFLPSRATLLANCMADCDLLDLYTVGGTFTWRKNIHGGGHVRKRLDRSVANIDWQMLFPHSLVEILPQHNSDHNPLLLSCSKLQSQKTNLFHFQAAWISHPENEKLVNSTWTQVGGTAIFKLGKVREKSILFNRETFGNIFRRKRNLEAHIKRVHMQLDSHLYSDLINLERALQKQYNEVLAQEELLWYQQSREKWVKLGNMNTKFFHAQTVIRRRRNKIAGLDINGIWCTNEGVLQNEALLYFKQVFQSNDFCNPYSLSINCFPSISQQLQPLLILPVSLDEVKNALFSMGPYKAPGPDGFQPIFFRTYWDIVAKDVWSVVANAFATGSIDQSLSETMIVPIPKVDEPRNLKDFRPIILCNVMFKLISKVLVNRIRPYLEDIISPLQSSFIPKRGTTDNALIAQELIHCMHKKKGKSGYLMYKIDFKKAYDRVVWNFLKLTLSEFGFPQQTINLIMNCTTSSSLSLKWNNVKPESFIPTRGLRQGDPMSPYLFVLCMEKLALLIEEKVAANQWLPIKVSKDGPAISHLFFAHDCLLFTKAKASQARLVQQVLDSFCLASGMKINIQKSRFLPSKNIPRSKVAKFESILHFQHTYNIGKYLSFPLLFGRVSKTDFTFILDRIHNRLAGWKSNLLSRAG